MTYLLVKHLHVAFVAVSGLGFFLRGLLMMRGSALLRAPLVRVLPHIVDTGLLATAIALAVTSRQYPLAQDWLTAKVIGLLAYIVLGTVALRRGRIRGARIAAWLAALAVFGYIVSVALTRNAYGPLA